MFLSLRFSHSLSHFPHLWIEYKQPSRSFVQFQRANIIWCAVEFDKHRGFILTCLKLQKFINQQNAWLCSAVMCTFHSNIQTKQKSFSKTHIRYPMRTWGERHSSVSCCRPHINDRTTGPNKKLSAHCISFNYTE